MPIDPITISAIVGGVAQLGQGINSFVQGKRMQKEAGMVKRPKTEVRSELEQNRAIALNRYNAYNPFIAHATNNINRQSANAGLLAQQTAADSAAALQAITQASTGANNAITDLMTQDTQIKAMKANEVYNANAALAADKNRVDETNRLNYMQAEQTEMAGQNYVGSAFQGVSDMAADVFTMAAMYPDAFGGKKSSGTGGNPNINPMMFGIGAVPFLPNN